MVALSVSCIYASVPQILHKAASATALHRPPSASLADAVHRVLNEDPDKIRLPDLDAVIELLRDRREDAGSQQLASSLLLLQAFLKHAR